MGLRATLFALILPAISLPCAEEQAAPPPGGSLQVTVTQDQTSGCGPDEQEIGHITVKNPTDVPVNFSLDWNPPYVYNLGPFYEGSLGAGDSWDMPMLGVCIGIGDATFDSTLTVTSSAGFLYVYPVRYECSVPRNDPRPATVALPQGNVGGPAQEATFTLPGGRCEWDFGLVVEEEWWLSTSPGGTVDADGETVTVYGKCTDLTATEPYEQTGTVTVAADGALPPEVPVTVTQPCVKIPGPDVIVEPTDVDLGAFCDQMQGTFEIYNVGDSTLTFSVVSDSAQVTLNPTGQVEPNAKPVKSAFVVTCKGRGPRTDVVKVLSDDPDEKVVSVNARSRCDCPEGESSGDPHLRTVDGLRYDLQSVGEFVLVRSDDVLVQVRQRPFGASRTVAGNAAVAARVGASRVTVYADRTPAVRLDGAAAPEEADLPGGGTLRTERGTTTVTWPSGERLVVSDRGFYQDVRFMVAGPPDGRYHGLLGNYDGDKATDLVGADGAAIAREHGLLHSVFADAWRIRPDESLFDYEPGETTATFTDAAFPEGAQEPADLPPEARAMAEAACRARGIRDPVVLDACVVDVGVSGDPDVALSMTEAWEREVPPAGGCSDGEREGFADPRWYPRIAGCSATWDGRDSLRSGGGGPYCGDDLGPCDAPGDACAPGWHVCGLRGPRELWDSATGEQCAQAGVGRFSAAVSQCSAAGPCAYAGGPVDPCGWSGDCAAPVCCGEACAGPGACADAVWPDATRIAAEGSGCALLSSESAGGVLCCADPTAPPRCRTGIEGEAGCVDVASALDGLRADLSCDPGSTSGGVCRSAAGRVEATATLGGTDLYDVTLRVRGVVEQTSYDGAVGDGLIQSGGKPANPDYNVATLEVSDPPATWRLNAGSAGKRRVWALDDRLVVQVRSGATVSLSVDALDGLLITNTDGDSPVIVRALGPEPFDGQFVALEVVEVRPALAVADFAGTWSGEHTLVLRVDGDRLVGSYSHDAGTLTAGWDGSVLRVWWAEEPSRAPSKDAGEAELVPVRGPDGRIVKLDGRWRYGADGGWDGQWDFTRREGDEPADLAERFAHPEVFVPHP